MKKRADSSRKKSYKKFLSDINNFVFSNFLKSIKHLRKLRYYSLFLFILFFISAIAGLFYHPAFIQEEVMEIIEEILQKTENLSGLGLISFIMINNIQTALMAFIFGAFFGIVPLAITVVNGYVLGFVTSSAVSEKGIWVVWRLFPHGIFEIPAVIISLSLGLRLGMFLFVFHKKNKKKEFWKWVKESIAIFVFIVIPLLVLAGIIEGLLIMISK